MEKTLLDLRKDLLGQPLERIDPLLLRSTLHRRLLQVGEGFSRADLESIIVAPGSLAVFRVTPASGP